MMASGTRQKDRKKFDYAGILQVAAGSVLL